MMAALNPHLGVEILRNIALCSGSEGTETNTDFT